MAFDRTDPADLSALKSEVNTDPIGMGYAAVLNSTAQLLQLLNDGANNVGGETVATELTAEVLLSVIDWDDYASNPVGVGGRGLTDNLIAYGSLTGVSLEQWRATVRAAYQPNSNTVQALDALVRTLSRAEVLFGAGTTITRDDWFAARDS
jgi:hypothetical protein